jgi:hypothetical protein
VLLLLEANPFHPSLRLHTLQGKRKRLYSVSINLSCRITIEFLIDDNRMIPIAVETMTASTAEESMMAGRSSLNAKNLQALGAARLAELLLTLSTGDAESYLAEYRDQHPGAQQQRWEYALKELSRRHLRHYRKRLPASLASPAGSGPLPPSVQIHLRRREWQSGHSVLRASGTG